MNVSIPIEELTNQQILDIYERIYDRLEEYDPEDEFVTSYSILTPLGMYKTTGDDQRREYQHLLKCLDLVDQDDYFGTEGWRHRFRMD